MVHRSSCRRRQGDHVGRAAKMIWMPSIRLRRRAVAHRIRIPVSQALSSSGMSTRAIAPVVGVDNKTVHNDLRRVENSTPGSFEPPDDESARSGETNVSPSPAVNTDTGEVPDDYEPDDEPEPETPITGMDGKTYLNSPRASLPPILPYTRRPARRATLPFFTALASFAYFNALYRLLRILIFLPFGEYNVSTH